MPSKISRSKILTNSKLFNGCVLHYTWLLLVTLLITIWIILYSQAIKMLKWFKAHCKLLFSVFCVLLIRLITCDMTYNQVWWPHTLNLCSAINPSKAHTHTQQWTNTHREHTPGAVGSRARGAVGVPYWYLAQSWYWGWRKCCTFTPHTYNSCQPETQTHDLSITSPNL